MQNDGPGTRKDDDKIPNNVLLTTGVGEKSLVESMSVPGALACLRLVLQSLCDLFPPSGTLLDPSDWANFVCQ